MTGNEPVVLVTGGSPPASAPPLCNACTARAGGRQFIIAHRNQKQLPGGSTEQRPTRLGNDGRGRSADVAALAPLVAGVVKHFRRLDALVNNASTYATPVGHIALHDWEALIGSNLRAPLFSGSGSRAASEGERWQHCQHHRHPPSDRCRITSSTTSPKPGCAV